MSLKSHRILQLGLTVGCLVVAPLTQAQDAKKDQVKDLHESFHDYDPQRLKRNFSDSDLNGDGLISMKEAKRATDRAFWTDERFNKADTNRDGLLSLEEAQAHRSLESQHADALDQKLKDKAKETREEPMSKEELARKLHERYPNATKEEIAQAVNNPNRARAASVLDRKYPEASKKQIRRGVKTLEGRGKYVDKKYPDARASDKKAYVTQPKRGERADRLYDFKERKGWEVDRKHAGRIVDHPKKAKRVRDARKRTGKMPRPSAVKRTRK